MVPNSSLTAEPYFIVSNSGVSSNYAYVSQTVRPALYLKSSVNLVSGEEDGSIDSPYKIINITP